MCVSGRPEKKAVKNQSDKSTVKSGQKDTSMLGWRAHSALHTYMTLCSDHSPQIVATPHKPGRKACCSSIIVWL